MDVSRPGGGYDSKGVNHFSIFHLSIVDYSFEGGVIVLYQGEDTVQKEVSIGIYLTKEFIIKLK